LAGTEDICRNYLPQEKDRMSLQLKNQRPKKKKNKKEEKERKNKIKNTNISVLMSFTRYERLSVANLSQQNKFNSNKPPTIKFVIIFIFHLHLPPLH